MLADDDWPAKPHQLRGPPRDIGRVRREYRKRDGERFELAHDAQGSWSRRDTLRLDRPRDVESRFLGEAQRDRIDGFRRRRQRVVQGEGYRKHRIP
jgi:hypothetical protein